jgi:hypothetical protein
MARIPPSHERGPTVVDTVFAGLLEQAAALDRCVTNVGFEGGVAAPSYERYDGEVAARITPAGDARYRSILGEQTHVSHQGYLSSDHDVEVGDLLVWKIAETELSEAAAAGATAIIVASPTLFEAGQSIEVGTGTTREAALVAATSGENLTLAGDLVHAHDAGEKVVPVRQFEVLYVRRWPGVEHHLELALNEVEM